MSIFKVFFQIINKNKVSIILGIAVTIFISFFYSNNIENESDLSSQKMKVAIFNEDKGLLAKNLEEYISENVTIVSLKHTQEALDDALYFDEVDYIITIPKDFSVTFRSDHPTDLTIQVRPDSFYQFFMQNFINQYLSKYAFYQQSFPEKDEDEIGELTKTTVNSTAKITIDSRFSKISRQTTTAKIFNILAYGLFACIITGLATVNLSFNHKKIKNRCQCSPLSNRKLSFMLTFSGILYTLILWAIFILYNLIYTSSGFNLTTCLLLLNSLGFTIACLGIGLFISSLITRVEAISGINNVVVLGSCFIGGVFIEQSILPSMVLKVASFTPTYWFVRTNNRIGKTIVFSSDFYREFWFNFLILLGFALLFFLLTLLVRREKGGLKLRAK